MLRIEINCEMKENVGTSGLIMSGVMIENSVNGEACYHEIEKAVKTMSENCAMLIKSVPAKYRSELMDACLAGMRKLES